MLRRCLHSPAASNTPFSILPRLQRSDHCRRGFSSPSESDRAIRPPFAVACLLENRKRRPRQYSPLDYYCCDNHPPLRATESARKPKLERNPYFLDGRLIFQQPHALVCPAATLYPALEALASNISFTAYLPTNAFRRRSISGEGRIPVSDFASDPSAFAAVPTVQRKGRSTSVRHRIPSSASSQKLPTPILQRTETGTIISG
jgi:hypothetical protein